MAFDSLHKSEAKNVLGTFRLWHFNPTSRSICLSANRFGVIGDLHDMQTCIDICRANRYALMLMLNNANDILTKPDGANMT